MKRIKGNNIKKIFYDEDNNSIIKTFNNKIARVEAKFWNEVTCLQLLHKNFVNKYNIHYPFPKLIHYNTDELSITTSYCGIQARLNTSIKPSLSIISFLELVILSCPPAIIILESLFNLSY